MISAVGKRFTAGLDCTFGEGGVNYSKEVNNKEGIVGELTKTFGSVIQSDEMDTARKALVLQQIIKVSFIIERRIKV